MKETIYICNRCRKKINDNGTRILSCFFDTATGEQLGDITVPDNDVHFCAECSKIIMNDLLKQPTGNTSKKSKTDKLPKADSKKAKVDTGKVMALHDAGWTNKDIAEEMNMTEEQVYKCIWYQEKKRKVKGADENET